MLSRSLTLSLSCRCLKLKKMLPTDKNAWNVVPMEWIVQPVHIVPAFTVLGSNHKFIKKGAQVDVSKAMSTNESYVNKYNWGA